MYPDKTEIVAGHVLAVLAVLIGLVTVRFLWILYGEPSRSIDTSSYHMATGRVPGSLGTILPETWNKFYGAETPQGHEEAAGEDVFSELDAAAWKQWCAVLRGVRHERDDWLPLLTRMECDRWEHR